MRAPLLLLILSAGLAAGCQYFRNAPISAVAELRPAWGYASTGEVSFQQIGDLVRVRALVTGLVPGREHAMHVHEGGDCGAADAPSAGDHFNPLGMPHAHFTAAVRHAGDLPALKADARGRAELVVDLDIVSLVRGPARLIGRSVVVHADPDDYRTQPAGNSGARIACGVIRRTPD